MKKMTVFLIVIVVAAAAALASLMYNPGGSSFVTGATGPGIEEIDKLSWETDEMITNLESEHVVRASFKFETTSTGARGEIETRDYQVRNAVIHRFAGLTAEELRGTERLQELESGLRKDINELLLEGEVTRVYTTGFVIQ